MSAAIESLSISVKGTIFHTTHVYILLIYDRMGDYINTSFTEIPSGLRKRKNKS